MKSGIFSTQTSSLLRRFLAIGAVAGALAVITATNCLAQQTGGGNTGGGNAGGGGTTGGGTTSGGISGSSSADDIRGADEVFADGVQRAGAPEARGIGTGGAEVAGAAGGNAGIFGGGGGGFGGLGGLGGLSQLFGGFGQAQQQTRSVRTRLSSAIAVEPVAPRMVAAAVNTRLGTLASRARFDGVQVELTGRKAVLNGSVENDADRRMAVLLVRLEPGVSQVEDRLKVNAN